MFKHFIYLNSVPKHPIIVVVACGDRLPEALNMIKSAIVFNRNAQHLEFIIIAEDHLKQQFTEKVFYIFIIFVV